MSAHQGKALRIILGDQLHAGISSLQGVDKEHDVVLMCEVWNEATYVSHHKKKIAFLFSAMRHFALELQDDGYKLDYVKLSEENDSSLTGEVASAVQRHNPDKVITTAPGEYRVLVEMKGWEKITGVSVEIRPDSRFLCSIEEFKSWASGRKQLRMEFFYREMRKKYKLLMDEDRPVGGAWNYDKVNRKSLSQHTQLPEPLRHVPDDITDDVITLVGRRFGDHFGDLHPFYFAVTRREALEVLEQFIKDRLPQFGDYQDAMLQGEPWLYHSHISFYLNCGLLTPLEVIKRAEEAFYEGNAPLNAVEGFVRQVLGWREFIRGIYWHFMPEYASGNYLESHRRLPDFYWTGATTMNCLRQCIEETRRHAYAHHIQRLMVLGNFALLAGIDPAEVSEWYLIVYADAYEWVEMPNVLGMVLFSDGGKVASKPYAASGAYIDRMSNYCRSCDYDVKKREGPSACPFNYLYWDFLDRNREKLVRNNRLSMAYRTLDRMSKYKLDTIRKDAAQFLSRLE